MTMPVFLCLQLAWLALPPQQPESNGRKELAEKVRKAHRGDSKHAIDRYKATITIKPVGKSKDNVQVDLSVKYGKKIERVKNVYAEMIRYSVNEGDKPVARGKDPRPWVQHGAKVQSLSGRHMQTDRDMLNSNTRLCRQMLQFLDPGAILAALEGNEPVTQKKLRVSRKDTIDTDFIRGKLASFPLFRKSRTTKKVGSAAVFFEAYVDQQTGRLAAVEIYPLDAKGKADRAQGELIFLRDYARSNGVLIPQELLIYDLNAGGPVPQVKVHLTEFELNAKLTKLDFQRPR